MPKEAKTRTSKKGATRFLHIEETFHFAGGGKIPRVDIAYETWGEPNADRSNGVLIMTGLSPSAHAASSEDDPTDGWWEPMIGPGKPIDTDRNFVICVNSLGSCKGSTGPASINPETGQQYRLSFPDLSIQDIAAAGGRVLDALGIESLRVLIGASMGGMSALALMRQRPAIARHFLAISTAMCAEPFAIAVRSLQREMIVRDPHWKDGAYTNDNWPETEARHDLLSLRRGVARPLRPPAAGPLHRAPVRHAFRRRVVPRERRAQVHPQFRPLQLPLPLAGHGHV
jgi:homoserine O-acetyltransferase